MCLYADPQATRNFIDKHQGKDIWCWKRVYAKIDKAGRVSIRSANFPSFMWKAGINESNYRGQNRPWSGRKFEYGITRGIHAYSTLRRSDYEKKYPNNFSLPSTVFHMLIKCNLKDLLGVSSNMELCAWKKVFVPQEQLKSARTDIRTYRSLISTKLEIK